MTKVTLDNVGSLIDVTTAQTTINDNSAAIVTAVENTLSRDGTSPNQMGASLDMNSNHILNLPEPVSGSSPLRLSDASILNGGGTISPLPAGGTTGQSLVKASNADYDFTYSGSVSSIDVTFPAGINVTGGPVTTSGVIAGSWAGGVTGTGANVFANSPTLITPNLGVAAATSVNKVNITAPLTSATLTILNGKTLTANNTITLAGTDATTITFQGTDTYVGRATTDTLTNKTLGATTLSGTVAGGGNQINNVIIGTTTPLAGTFTTLTANTSVSSPIHASSGKYTFQSNGSTFAGSISAGQQWMLNASDVAPAAGAAVTISKNTAAPIQATLNGVGKTNVALQLGTTDGSQGFVVFDNYGNTSGPSMIFRSGQGTQASPTATQNNDFLFNFYAQGYGATAPGGFGAFFGAKATETWTDSAQGNCWTYWTIANGSTSLLERVRVGTGLMVGTFTDPGVGAIVANAAIKSIGATAGIGYGTGAGGTVTQATSRTTGVTLNKVSGAITLFSAAGSASYNTFTVTNSAVAATDTISVSQKSGTDKYEINVTAVTAGTFDLTYRTTGGTTVEQPVFNFNVIKGVAA